MSDARQLAEYYFDLSNKAALPEIRKLFTTSSTYSSENTGVYLGVDQIMEMQAKFFAGFESLSWKINKVEESKPGVILFDFTFTGTTLDKQVVTNNGLEYVIVYQGKIQHVEVRFRL